MNHSCNQQQRPRAQRDVLTSRTSAKAASCCLRGIWNSCVALGARLSIRQFTAPTCEPDLLVRLKTISVNRIAWLVLFWTMPVSRTGPE